MSTWIHFSVSNVTQSHATIVAVVTGEHRGLTVSGSRTKSLWCTSNGREMELAELAELVSGGASLRVRVSL